MSFSVSSSYLELRSIVESTTEEALPPPSSVSKAVATLYTTLPSTGLGDEETKDHLLNDVTHGFNGPKTSANYYGFVTGGVLPIAEVADNIVTAFDQNVQVHLPDQSISTIVEDRALAMLVEILNLGNGWEGRTFTTGATGANILGLACGREAIISKRLSRHEEHKAVGEMGLLAACAKAKVKEIQILTTMGHTSLYKAASVVGLGRASVFDLPLSSEEPWKMNIDKLEKELKRSEHGIVSVVAISAGEVNTGRFATDGWPEMKRIRDLCDKYGAWLHVDGAFGLFARSLPQVPEFEALINSTAGLELADSIAGDCHKLLNVPYDCGFFLTRSASTLSSVFQNPNAAYLSSEASDIPSPLNIGLENSRRFRALPVYAVLLAHGRDGLADIFAGQVRLARSIKGFLEGNEAYEVLAKGKGSIHGENEEQQANEDTHIVVLFRAKYDDINKQLVSRINRTRKMYVSGTKWDGQQACRIAVSTWKADVQTDLMLIAEVLEDVLNDS